MNRSTKVEAIASRELLSVSWQARTADADRMRKCISAIALSNRFSELTALDMITDGDGNTLLHIAALHGHISCIREIQLCFLESHGRPSGRKQRFTMRPNKTERNTALHLAARHGDLPILRAVYRLFCGGWLPGYESYGVEPAEDATDRLDGDKFGPTLVFLRTQNAVGRDAAAEARVVGRETNVRWCEDVVTRLDPVAKDQSPEALTELS